MWKLIFGPSYPSFNGRLIHSMVAADEQVEELLMGESFETQFMVS